MIKNKRDPIVRCIVKSPLVFILYNLLSQLLKKTRVTYSKKPVTIRSKVRPGS